MHSRAPSLLFVALLLGIDAVAIAAFRNAPEHGNSLILQDQTATDEGWALCQTQFRGQSVSPVSVAVTYLDTGLDRQITPDQVHSWFSGVDGVMVDVYKLIQRDGKRRISFEISRSKWPVWGRIAGDLTGPAVCGVIRAELMRAKVGRPYPAGQNSARQGGDAGPVKSHLDRSRYDFEFIYARRPTLYRSIQWIGTLDHALESDRFVRLQSWLGGEIQ